MTACGTRLGAAAVGFLLAASAAVGAPSRSELDERVLQLERLLENQGAQRVELARQLDLLQAELRAIRGQVEELQFALSGAKEQQRQQYLDLDGRLQAVEEQAKQLASTATVGAADPAAEYQAAFELLKAGQYPEARSAFLAFLDAYPEHELASNARYWLGEAHYVEKQFEPALSAFGRVLKDYPQARKAPDALLKSGYCLYELKRYTEARSVLSRVMRDYADTQSAIDAARRLERMDAEGR